MNERNKIVFAAQSWLGTPYLHQGAKKQIGCDCLGLILGVGRELNIDLPTKIPAYSANWRDPRAGTTLEQRADQLLVRQTTATPQTGAILLFRMRRDLPAKHCAILITPDTMIHAQEGVGVIEAAYEAAWQRRLVAHYHFKFKA